MSGFNGPRSFGKFAGFGVLGAIAAATVIGPIAFVPIVIAGYFLLHFTNQLEARDIRDRGRRRK